MAESEPSTANHRSFLAAFFDVVFVAVRSVILVALAGGIAATIFSWWTPTDFLPQAAREGAEHCAGHCAGGHHPDGAPCR
ncbi:MAG: hypothetical protein M5R40_12870 [Anaerolineae bacterium]|nr:hypothetical protein [Anaerolineae bacterium]